MAIKLTDKLQAVTTEGVIVDASQVAGGYMSVANKSTIGDALKVDGMLIFETSTKKSFRWDSSSASWVEQTDAATVASNLSTHVNSTTDNPHNVTKANVGLGNVVNTGDSATPVSGGTTKFTTGGAYTELNKKVDKVTGKGLSTNDYTTAEKDKLAGIAEGANKTIVDGDLSDSSTNPVQNKVVKSALDGKAPAEHTHSSYVNQNAFSNVKVGQTTVAANSATDTIEIVAGTNVTITPDATNDKITISATDTVYAHPSHTSASEDLYKVTVDSLGHVTKTTKVTKSDITNLGIPAQDTTYSAATTSAAGLMSAEDKEKLDGIDAQANKYSLPEAGSSLGGVKTGGDVTISDGVITVNDDSHNHIISNIDGLQNALDGKASLENGKVPQSQLPSYVDDIIEGYYNLDDKLFYEESFYTTPITGETGKIYVDLSTNKTYRWGGSTSKFVVISETIAIGTTTGTALDGKVGNDHITNTNNPHEVTKSQVGLGSVVNTGDSATPVKDGTTKFTTGGAYTELNKKVDKDGDKVLSTNDYTTAEKNKLAGIASGAEVNVQSDWNVTDTSSDAYIQNKIPFKNGTGNASVAFADGVASGNYAFAGGTADKELLTSLVGSTLAGLVTVKEPVASGSLSVSLGTNNESTSAGSMTIGVSNKSGITGYYWHSIDFANKKITLSTERRASSLSSAKAPSSLDWQKGDYISIVNGLRYIVCSKITSISGNTITVDSLPFDAENYDTTLTLYSYSSPDDRTIFAMAIDNFYEKEDTSISEKLNTNSKYTFRTGTVQLGFGSIVIGGMNAGAGIFSLATGFNNLVAGRFSHAEGMKNIAGDVAHVEGIKNKALGMASHSEGLYTQSIGNTSHAEGQRTIAEGSMGAHAEGTNTYAKQNGSHAEGEGTNIVNEDGSITPGKTGAFGWRAHSEGRYTTANGNGAHSEGMSTIADGTGSHSEGSNTYAKGAHSHAEGLGTNTQDKKGDVILGVTAGTTGAFGAYSHSEGYQTTAEGDASHAAGTCTIAEGESQTVVGKYNIADKTSLFIVGDGTSNSARSNAFKIAGDGKAYNGNNEAYALSKDIPVNLSALASDTTHRVVTDTEKNTWNAKSDFSGDYRDLTYKPSIPSNLKNGSSTGSLYQSSAKILTDTNNKGGTASAPTQIYPNYAVAFGSGVACGDKAFACGSNTLAYKNGAHAEGEGSIIYLDDNKTQINVNASTGAFGWYSHTEGRKTTARGDSAHAEGRDTVAKANQTHAEGYGTIASSTSQHVQGKYNIEDASNTYADIVGNGYSTTSNGVTTITRSNAYTLDWNGNSYHAGNVYANYNWTTKTGKKLATEEYVNNAIDGSTGGLPVDAPDGAFLRFRTGFGWVAEVLSNAEEVII